MKKLVLNPLELDKETIAKLDDKQLQEITGGLYEEVGSTGCGSGASTCGGGTSTGCGTGGSTCAIS